MMEQEFTISKGLKIIYGALSIFLAGFALFLFGIDDSKAGTVVLVIPISLLVLAFIIIANQIRSKVIISDNSITRIGAFSRKELQFSEIKGSRIGQKGIYIEPISSSKPKIRINNYIDLRNNDELVKWLKEHFSDLDAVNLNEHRDRSLQDQNLGLNEAERTEKLNRTKQVAIGYNVIGSILGFSLIFTGNNYTVALIMLFYPVLGVLVMIFSKGLIKFVSDSTRSVYPWIALGFMFPVISLLIKSLGDYDISRYDNLWLPFIIASSIIFILLITIGLNRTIGSLIGQTIFMLITSLGYGFGATIQTNCVFDNSKPKVFQTTVIDQYVNHGKGTAYYLTVNPWEPGKKPKDIAVSHSFYDKKSKGSMVNIYLKNGLLNISWFTVSN